MVLDPCMACHTYNLRFYAGFLLGVGLGGLAMHYAYKYFPDKVVLEDE